MDRVPRVARHALTWNGVLNQPDAVRRPASRLVIGAAQFGQSYGRSGKSAPGDAEIAQILRLATELDCAGIDTARAYGNSEAAIGRARRSGAGASLPLVTKIRPLPDLDEAGVRTAVHASLTESLSLLGSAHVGAVLLHRAVDLTRAGGAAVGVLRTAREHGLIGRWGVSVSDPDELVAALTFPDLGYVQLPFNIVDRRWLTAHAQAALAERPDVTVVARSVFLQGILLRPDAGTWPRGALPDAASVSTALDALAARSGRSIAGLCIGFALAQPWIDAVVIGVRSAHHLSQLALEMQTPPLTADDCERLLDTIPAGSAELVDPARWPPR